ncbi:unnamed protein product [Durusdinium trenchii]|uniref:Pseudouridine synthase RsuA/RluA-like domain-containing protein n=1 Tax=Durusdinium trenchii TaxID=1381693 RepID=A0ABP0PN65_9DINO
MKCRPKQLLLVHDPSVTFETLYEDDHVLAIAKPFGVLAHPSPGFWAKGTLAHALVGRVSDEMMQERGDHNEWDSYIPRCIVHRLDSGTTGVMVIAKSPSAEKSLAHQLRAVDMLDMAHEGKKLYVALLLGHPGSETKSCITANGAIGRHPQNARLWAVIPGGKPAKTIFRVHAFSKKHGLSLVTAELFSGRTHQIRVHAAFLGSPVANDNLYARSQLQSFRHSFGKGLAERRQLLHAWALNIEHPLKQRRRSLQLRAPLPQDMANIIQQVWPGMTLNPTAWSGMPGWHKSETPRDPMMAFCANARHES